MASAAMAGAIAITIITGIGMATGAIGTIITITTGRAGTITITAITTGAATGITITTAIIATGTTATAGERLLRLKRPPVPGPAGVFVREKAFGRPVAGCVPVPVPAYPTALA